MGLADGRPLCLCYSDILPFRLMYFLIFFNRPTGEQPQGEPGGSRMPSSIWNGVLGAGPLVPPPCTNLSPSAGVSWGPQGTGGVQRGGVTFLSSHLYHLCNISCSGQGARFGEDIEHPRWKLSIIICAFGGQFVCPSTASGSLFVK